MAERPQPAAPLPVVHAEQWRAAKASRRELLPEIVIVKQPWSRARLAALMGIGMLAGVLIGVGGSLAADTMTPAAATVTPLIIVLEITATPMPTAQSSPTPAPDPTIIATPTVTRAPTATHIPTATPSATPISPARVTMAVIEARALNVRAGPGIDYNIVGYAARGQRYRIVDHSKDGSWLWIDFDGLVGWISAVWVEIEGR